MKELSIDFHVHSKYSYDSLTSPSMILRFAKRNGLHGVAITDHNTIKGGLDAYKLAKNDNFLVIIGSEIKTDKGDLVGIFLNEEIKSRDFFEVSDEIKDQGGLRILPHPYLTFFNIDKEILKCVDLIEVFNGRVKSQKMNESAMRIATENSYPICGGSDAHFPWQVGNVRTVFNECSMSQEEITSNLLKGNVSIKGKNMSIFNYIVYRHVVGRSIRYLKGFFGGF